MTVTLDNMEHLPLSAATAEGDSVFTAGQKAWIEAAYLEVFGRSVRRCNCRNRFADAAIEIKTRLKDMDSRYHMKAGMLLWIGPDAYTRKTVTDAIAEGWFRSLPEGCDRQAVWQRYFGDSPKPETAPTCAAEPDAESKPKPKKTTKKTTKK